jgi:hypothetical protein
MKTPFTWLLLILLMVSLLSGCAPGPNPASGTAGEHRAVAGFWLGVWQGFIAPFVFVASLFTSNLGIYEVHNSGSWYNLGYLFGIACFYGGGGKGVTKQGCGLNRKGGK